MRLEQPPSIAGALAHGNDLDRLEGFELVQRQLDRRGEGIAFNLEAPFRSVDFGNAGQMITDKECIIGRDHVFEIADRRLEIGRTIAELDERDLPGERLELSSLAQSSRQSRLQP